MCENTQKSRIMERKLRIWWDPFPVLYSDFLLAISHVLVYTRHCCSLNLSHPLLANKGPSSQGYGFSSSHVWMWELDCEESWAPKNWCYWAVVLEKTLASPLDCKEIQPVHPKGHQSWDFFGGNDAKAETTVLWSPHVKSWLIGKNSDAGRDWRQ